MKTKDKRKEEIELMADFIKEALLDNTIEGLNEIVFDDGEDNVISLDEMVEQAKQEVDDDES